MVDRTKDYRDYLEAVKEDPGNTKPTQKQCKIELRYMFLSFAKLNSLLVITYRYFHACFGRTLWPNPPFGRSPRNEAGEGVAFVNDVIGLKSLVVVNLSLTANHVIGRRW